MSWNVADPTLGENPPTPLRGLRPGEADAHDVPGVLGENPPTPLRGLRQVLTRHLQ